MWDERYSADDYIYGTAPNEFLEAHYAAIPKGDVLCLGDGEGRNGVFLAERGYRVTAVDASSVGLKKAEKLAAERGVSIQTVHADLATFDLGQRQWAGIVSIFCHLPAPLRKDLHRRVLAALREGGVYLLESYTPEQLGRGTGGPSAVEWLVSEAILREELPGMNFSHLVELEREVREGQFHTGMGAVVQAIGTVAG